jgi:hypothetical protein
VGLLLLGKVRPLNTVPFPSHTSFNFSAHPKSKPLSLHGPLMGVPSHTLWSSVSRCTVLWLLLVFKALAPPHTEYLSQLGDPLSRWCISTALWGVGNERSSCLMLACHTEEVKSLHWG